MPAALDRLGSAAGPASADVDRPDVGAPVIRAAVDPLVGREPGGRSRPAGR